MTAGIMLATNPSKWNQTSPDKHHQREMTTYPLKAESEVGSK